MTFPIMKLKLPHITVRRNKNGTVRYYFRRRGCPMQPLPGDPMSPEFMVEYQSLLNPLPPTDEGSFAWLCDEYMNSPEFRNKAQATRTARRRVIISMLAEPINPQFPETFGMERANNIGRAHVITLRDRKSEQPNAANERLKILSQIFKHALARDWRDDNPVRDVPRLTTPRGGHRTATDADIAAYMTYHTGGPARRAIVLLMAFGMRVSDLRVLGPQHVRKGRLVFRTVKTDVLCDLTISTEAAAEMRGCNGLVYMTSNSGVAFASDKALSQRVAKWFRQAGVERISAHGVRKWLATKMAEGGATEYELMAWFGWKDPKEARPYVQAANRKTLATKAGNRVARLTNV